MSDLKDFINSAVEAARKDNLVPRSSPDAVEKEADEDAGEDNPDLIVEEHLKQEAAKEASAEIHRAVKLGFYAMLTAGDSLLAVDRCRREREGS